MTASFPFTAPAAPRHERLRVMGLCEAYCAATGTSHSILALALTGNSGFFLRLIERQVSADGLTRCERSLEVLQGLDAAAGPLVQPSRSGGRGDDAKIAKEDLRQRVEDIAAAMGARPQLVAIAVTHDSTLLRASGGVSDAQYATYHARIEKIAHAFGVESRRGEADGQEAQGTDVDIGQVAAE